MFTAGSVAPAFEKLEFPQFIRLLLKKSSSSQKRLSDGRKLLFLVSVDIRPPFRCSVLLGLIFLHVRSIVLPYVLSVVIDSVTGSLRQSDRCRKRLDFCPRCAYIIIIPVLIRCGIVIHITRWVIIVANPGFLRR